MVTLSSPFFLQLLRILSPLQRQDKEPLLSSPAPLGPPFWLVFCSHRSEFPEELEASPLLSQLPTSGGNKLQSLAGLLAVSVCPCRVL